MFILSIAKGNKEIGTTIATHFIVGLFTILVHVQFCFQSDKNCSVEYPSISSSVETGELSVEV